MQDGFIERFNGSYCRSMLELCVFRAMTEVREHTERWPHAHGETIPVMPWGT